MAATIFERFVQESRVTIIVRATLGKVCAAPAPDHLFVCTAERHYTRTLLFFTEVELMTTIVLHQEKSIHTACQQRREQLAVGVSMVEHWEDKHAVLIVDETGLVKKGEQSVGVQGQIRWDGQADWELPDCELRRAGASGLCAGGVNPSPVGGSRVDLVTVGGGRVVLHALFARQRVAGDKKSISFVGLVLVIADALAEHRGGGRKSFTRVRARGELAASV